MKKLDGRKLSHKTREEIRIRAVKQVESGESPEEIIKALGFHRSCIYEWLAQYREGGEEALRTKPITGCPPKLNGSQLQKLYQIITEKDPLQLKFSFALWTCAMVRELLKEEFGVRLSEVSVGRLLKKVGLSPQRPLRRAYQQDPERVERWKTEEYPAIRRMAKKEKAIIYFGDEAAVRSDHHSGTTWGPIGRTPYGSPVFVKSDFGHYGQRGNALHDDSGAIDRRSIHRVLETADPQCGPSGLFDCRWSPGASFRQSPELCRFVGRKIAVILPPSVFSGIESG